MAQTAAEWYDAEVEYLESTGTQYIKVGSIIGATSMTIIVAATEIPSSGATKFYGIGFLANFQDDFGLNATGWGGYSSYPCTIGVPIEFKADNSGLYIDGTKYLTTQYFKNSVADGNEMFLFCGSSGRNAYITGSGNYMAWRGWISSCVIMSVNVKMFDFIPVRVGTVGYMYDKVSGQLFGNSGTGDFLIGNDV